MITNSKVKDDIKKQMFGNMLICSSFNENYSWCSSVLPNMTACFSFYFISVTGSALKKADDQCELPN